MNLWRAGCVETCKSGSEGGSRKRTGREAGTAPRSDPYTHFAGCPKHAVFAVMDLVTRKWICELVSIEETSTQVQVVFMDALEQEGLLELIEARLDAVPADTFPFDAAVNEPDLPPILLAVSDNGPQMTSGSTREFMPEFRSS